MTPAQAAGERSFSTVVRDIGGNVDRIVRAELRIAIAEVREGMRAAGGAFVLLLGGLALVALGLLFLLLGAMFALALVMPIWAAALLIGGIVLGGATLLMIAGRAQLPHAMLHGTPAVLSPPEPAA